MAYKILEKNGVDNENIDGAAFNNFSAGGRDGIVAGVLSECSLSLSGNVIGIAPGELIMHGFRVKITETETFSNSSVPVSAEKYQIIAQIVVSENNDVVFSFLIRSPATLIQENIFDNNRGTYQIEIGTYMHNPDGSISELTRTVQVFYADIHKSAKEAKAASKEAAASAAAAQNAAKDAAQAASIAIADYITHTKNGAAVGEVDTLAGAKAEVSVESKNLFTTAGFRETWQGTTVQNGTNGFTYTRDPNSTQSSYVEYYCETPNGEITISFETSITGSMTDKRPNMFYVFDGLPIVGAQIAIVNLGEDQTNQSHVVTVKATKGGISFRFYANVLATTETGGEYTAVFENVQFESGASATAFTPYLPAGTAVEVQACGKNLFDLNADKYWGSADITERAGSTFTVSGQAGTWIAVEFILPEIQNKTLTVSGEWITSGSNVGGLRVQWITQNGIAVGDTIAETYISGQAATGTVPKKPDNAKYLGFFVYSNTNGTVTGSTSVTYENVQLEIGETATYYASYEGLTYPATVGQTIEVKQYDRITNIFTNTAGASLAVQFKISTQLYLDRFGLIEEGLFANRPTDISEQSRVYIATDRFDNSRYTYLKGGVDGSVTENWTEIVNYGQDNLQTKVKELVPAINEVNAAAGIALLNIPKSAKETGAFISGDNTLAGAKAEVSVESKNLIPFPYANGGAGSTVTKNGVTFTVNADQSVTVNGTASSGTGFDFIYQGTLKKAGYYTLSTKYNLPEGLLVVMRKNGTSWMDASSSNPFVTGYYNNGDTGVQCNIWVPGGSTVTNAIVYPQLEYGETATAYTPYLPTGTAVEVQACGKNLFDVDEVRRQRYTSISASGNRSTFIKINNNVLTCTLPYVQDSSFPNVPIFIGTGNYVVSADCYIPTDSVQGNRILFGIWNVAAQEYERIDTTMKLGTWINLQIAFNIAEPTEIYFQFQQYGKSLDTTCDIQAKNIQIETGGVRTNYCDFESLTYPSTVGETIEVEQYDRITNIFSNTTGGAVCTQFLQSTRYELETKPVSLAGTYAERPTGTYPYVMLYTATDTGRTYRLERDTDGSVSSNWVNISSAGGTGGGFTPRGEWNSTTTYNENDLVSLNGSSYICIEENTNATPASNPDKWMVNAEKGATGATGTTGAAGIDGHSVYTSTDVCSANVGETCGAYKDTTSAKGIGDVIITANGKVFTVERETVISGRGVWEGICTAIIIGPQGPQGEPGEQGQQGPAGANGTNGKDYLIYKDGTITGSSNVSSFSTMVNNEDFNRTPVIGEYFICNYEESNSVGALKIYSCIFEVALVGDTQTLVSVFQYKLVYTDYYEHHITFNQNGVARAIFTITNSRKSTYSTVGDLISYLEPQKPYQMNGWYRESSSNICWGVSCIITTDGKLNFIFCGNSGEVSYEVEEDEIITDLTIKL